MGQGNGAMLISVLALPQAASLSEEKRRWFAEKAESYRDQLISEGVPSEEARRRSLTRVLHNLEQANV